MKTFPMQYLTKLCGSPMAGIVIVMASACGTGEAREPAHKANVSLFASENTAPSESAALPAEKGDVAAAYAVAAVAPRKKHAPRTAEAGLTPAPRHAEAVDAESLTERPVPHGLERPNVVTDFSPEISAPRLDRSVFLDPLASVVGAVEIGKRVYIAPFASLRGDEGQPIHIGNETNIQDGVVIHALETIADGVAKFENTVEVGGAHYAVHIGNRVSLAHQSQVHGPAWIEDNVFIGMKALIFKAHIGRGSVVEPAANVIGVTVPPGRYVKAGTTITDQATANALPVITESYAFRSLNDAVVHVNTSFADAYPGRKQSAAPYGATPRHPR